MADFVEVLHSEFVRIGLDTERALDCAERGVIALGNYCGGRSMYLPTGARLKIALRDRRIFAAYRGTANKAELARRYRVSERTIEMVVAKQHARHLAELRAAERAKTGAHGRNPV